MCPGLNGEHHVSAPEDTAYGVHPSGDGFPQEHKIGFHGRGPFVAKEFPGPSDPGLDLVADEEDVVFPAKSLCFG